MFDLRIDTSTEWLTNVLDNLDPFLIDHAACERKASATALSFVVRYPNRKQLVEAMIDLAQEELAHFQQLTAVIHERGLTLGADSKDPYVNGLLKHVRGPSEERLLDRLLTFGVIEGRGCERFMMLAKALSPSPLKQLYTSLVASEARHHAFFLHHVRKIYPQNIWRDRLNFLLDVEAELVRTLPIRSALH